MVAGYTSLSTVFFGIVVGGAVTVTLTLLPLWNRQGEPLKIYLFWGMVVLWILAFYLGARVWIDRKGATSEVESIKRQATPITTTFTIQQK